MELNETKQKEYYLGKNERGEFSAEAEAKLAKFKIGKSNEIEKMKAQIEFLNLEIARLKSRLNMPTSPGWYWAIAQGEPEPVVFQVIESARLGVKELFCKREGDIWGPVLQSECIVQWLGPVAPCEY